MTEPKDFIVPFNDSAGIRGISRSTQYARIAAGLISPPRRNGPRLSGWLHSELMAELKQLPAEMPRRPDHLKSKKIHKPPKKKPQEPHESILPGEK
jgi:predicted DNA-binding transcriptional regulator AlpA